MDGTRNDFASKVIFAELFGEEVRQRVNGGPGDCLVEHSAGEDRAKKYMVRGGNMRVPTSANNTYIEVLTNMSF